MDVKQLVGWVLVVGAVNWGLVGLVGIDAIEMLLGKGTLLSKAVYMVVGAAGLYKAYLMVVGKKK